MGRFFAFILACVLALSAAIVAQAPKPVLVDSGPMPNIDLNAEPAPLTASEKQDIEILTLKAQLASAQKSISDLQAAFGACQAQLGPAQFEQQKQALTAEQAALKERFEKARPGWVFDPATGQFTKKPDPPVKK